MYELFRIASSSGSTPVMVSDESLTAIAERYQALPIIDVRFASTVDRGSARTITIAADEEQKALDNIPRILKACRDAGLTRDGRILAVGGGIIQDIASFVASIYMRGVKWDYIPTTLLAMADSCIGGKSSINVGPYKNLAGTFHPPASIVIAPSLVSTLSKSQVASGLCEASKICFAKNPESFAQYLSLYASFKSGNTAALTKLIGLSLSCKKWFIEIDEFDRAERLLLNFGHSFGHALESATNYALEHGVSVGVGILAAIALGKTRNPELEAVSEVSLLEQHILELLVPLPELRGQLDAVNKERFVHYFSSDKKHTPSNFRPILLTSAGRLERQLVPRGPDAESSIWNAFTLARHRLRDATTNPRL